MCSSWSGTIREGTAIEHPAPHRVREEINHALHAALSFSFSCGVREIH
jgi:hypothetical protein